MSSSSATLIIKWSKTLQRPGQYKCIRLPHLGQSELCPIRAFTVMCHKLPLHGNAPMFCVPQGRNYVTLTESKIRKMLTAILSTLGLQDGGLTFHAFRRSGASFAFHNNVSISEIKKHGTWAGESVWSYIVEDAMNSDKVTNMLENLLRQ